MSEESKTKRAKNWMQISTTFRMGIVGFLIIILLIPLAFIKDLIRERKQRQNEVVSEINETWGEEVQLYGPIVKIPYYLFTESTITDRKTKKVQTVTEKTTKHAYFFPDRLDVHGDIQSETKSRGIYTTAVYTTNISIEGSFNMPNIGALEIPNKDIQWEKAQVIMETTNLKGINDAVEINLNDISLAFESNFNKNLNNKSILNEYGTYESQQVYSIETKSFNAKELFKNGNVNFKMSYNASGSHGFQIIPIGKETSMHLTSNWKDANFMGEYLPYNPDKITDNGFDAHWKVLQMNRPFSQQFKSLPDLDDFSFGVEFFIPVDDYQQNERTAKYGYLMIALTFLLFFLIQTLSKIYIHPFQYLMIGLALVIFYTLLISISEHSDFTKAYVIAAIAVIGLITLYSKSIMKNWKFPLFIGLSLSILYGFIFVIIQLENYALLVGSIGLFVILAIVMYASRKIDWS